MDDLISRKWLIECVEEGWIQFETEKDENKFIHLVRDIAPSAQPETHEERTETHACDCISRRAAIDAVSDACFELRGVFGRCEDALKALPPAQPERKKGKWNTYYHSDIDFSHSCNQCGYSAPCQMIGGEVIQKKWNFCPNCGADMRGEQDG